ncbi:MAG TPA: hypothetical protein VKE74_28750 [Gemmataceae bacterium]|nr:hypothetical protein [Gemmataceae bacterium]
MSIFTEVRPTLDNYWRAVILFGRNVASYKFALGKTLLQFAVQGKSVVPMTDLSLPFARHLAEHLKSCDKQATSRSSSVGQAAAPTVRVPQKCLRVVSSGTIWMSHDATRSQTGNGCPGVSWCQKWHWEHGLGTRT